jgi:ADP-heptose:LPS heptosyltransferase
MKKFIFKCNLSLGDIVLLTAAVRDLHLYYPGLFATDVRTSFPELWAHNPFLTPLDEYDANVTILECQDLLLQQSNESACHALHGFFEFLNRRLGFRLKPTAFRGDIYLSPAEKAAAPPLRRLAGEDIPYWLIAAGGKFDYTIKWWDGSRYQEVVDYFSGRIQFVQVGDLAHYHPPLRGVVDLRGRTPMRELLRLVYHAQGVLCGVTGLMHLASAVPVLDRHWPLRPCVVIAGGREPAHWEAYPGHQLIHTIGALPCCAADGCWKSRTAPLGDGDEKDRPEELCQKVHGGLPRCMELITSAEVVRRMETYFAAGPARSLAPHEARAAARAVAVAAAQAGLEAPLNICTVREQADRFIACLPHSASGFRGRGIVICGGGVRLFTNVWVCVRMLRDLGCTLPIELWHLGEAELDEPMRALVRPLGIECVDALALTRKHPARQLHGWVLKSYALLHSTFEEVLMLDADNLPVANPEFLFDTPEYRQAGAVLWPDLEPLKKEDRAWGIFGVPYQDEPSVESGQMLLNKAVCWRALTLAWWYNDHADFYYQHVYGDKETFHFAFRKLEAPFAMPTKGVEQLRGAMCQHDFAGRRLFQHRNMDKWTLFPINRRIAGFWHEEKCREFLRELGESWDARLSRFGTSPCRNRGVASIAAVMISCAARERLRARTLEDLRGTDWGSAPVQVIIDEQRFRYKVENITHTAWRALQAGQATRADYLLFLADDLIFNRHLHENLQLWSPLQERHMAVLALYNPGLAELAWDVRHHAILAAPNRNCASQAMLLSRQAVRYLLDHWFAAPVPLELKFGWLAAQLGQPIVHHCPSLVQHVGNTSTWGGVFHRAGDFRRAWKEQRL